MDVFERKNKRYHKHFTKISTNKVLRDRLLANLFLVSFASFKSRYPSGNREMPRAGLRVRAQGNITVLSHVKRKSVTISKLKICESFRMYEE